MRPYGLPFAIALLFLAASAHGQTEVPHTFESGEPARAAEVNQNFSALEGAVNKNAQNIASLGDASGKTFDLILIDSETGEQVGVASAGGDAWKLLTSSGSALVQYGPMRVLPTVDTATVVTEHWLSEVTAFYSCNDASLLGWQSTWVEPVAQRPASQLPVQYANQYTTVQFGSLPSGDVVLAEVAHDDSLVWGGNYTDVLGLDPNASSSPPLLSGACFIVVDVRLGDYQELMWSPFNMTWSTTLPDIVHNARNSASLAGPDEAFPQLWFSSQITGGDPNPGSPLVDDLIAQCNSLAQLTENACYVYQTTNEAEITVGAPQNIVLKKASYTKTTGISSVTPVAELPGNRGKARSFTRTWK